MGGRSILNRPKVTPKHVKFIKNTLYLKYREFLKHRAFILKCCFLLSSEWLTDSYLTNTSMTLNMFNWRNLDPVAGLVRWSSAHTFLLQIHAVVQHAKRLGIVLLEKTGTSLKKTSSGWLYLLLQILNVPFTINGAFTDVTRDATGTNTPPSSQMLALKL